MPIPVLTNILAHIGAKTVLLLLNYRGARLVAVELLSRSLVLSAGKAAASLSAARREALVYNPAPRSLPPSQSLVARTGRRLLAVGVRRRYFLAATVVQLGIWHGWRAFLAGLEDDGGGGGGEGGRSPIIARARRTRMSVSQTYGESSEAGGQLRDGGSAWVSTVCNISALCVVVNLANAGALVSLH